MPLDVNDLVAFYASPLGDVARRLIGRVLAPGGRAMFVVPSRRGVWARVDGNPFGQGQPYSKTQLRDLMREAEFSPIFWVG